MVCFDESGDSSVHRAGKGGSCPSFYRPLGTSRFRRRVLDPPGSDGDQAGSVLSLPRDGSV